MARQAIAGKRAQRLAWVDRVEVDAGRILGAEDCVADAGVQARDDLARHVQLDSLAGGALGGAVVAFFEQRPGRTVAVDAARGLAKVILLQVEHGQRGVHAAVEEFALDARFVGLALDRVEHIAREVLQVLRLEDAGVAGVQRVGVVQVEHEAGVGRDLVVVLERVRLSAKAFFFILGHACADDGFQAVGQREARHAVQALLGGFAAFIERLRAEGRRRVRSRVPVVDVGHGLVCGPVVRQPVVRIEIGFCMQVAEGSFVLTLAQRELAARVYTEILLLGLDHVRTREGIEA